MIDLQDVGRPVVTVLECFGYPTQGTDLFAPLGPLHFSALDQFAVLQDYTLIRFGMRRNIRVYTDPGITLWRIEYEVMREWAMGRHMSASVLFISKLSYTVPNALQDQLRQYDDSQ